MKHRQDAAFVLGTSEIGEADLIVTLLGESAGRVRGVAPSARKSRRRFGGCLEPLTRVRARWVEREGRELHRIEALEIDRSYAAMQSEPERQAACAVVSEIAAATSREGQGDAREFRLLGAVLDALEAGLDPWIAVRYFEFWTLRLQGVLADLDACAGCGRALDPSGAVWAVRPAGFACPACRGGGAEARRLAPSDRALLSAFGSRPPAETGAFAMAARPGGAADWLLRGSIEALVERPLRSYRHLRALVP